MNAFESADTLEQRYIARAAKHKSPINGSLELTPMCNLRCGMCYVRLEAETCRALGGIRPGEDWLRLGEELKTAGTLFLLLTGGEPLAHPDFREIYTGLKAKGFFVTINTNGTLIDEAWADFLAANMPRRMNITLYGGSRDAYERLCGDGNAYERCMRGIRLLLERKVPVKLAFSAANANAGELDRVKSIADELGVPLSVDTYMMPAARERRLPYALQARLAPEAAAGCRIRALRRELGEERFFAYARKMLSDCETGTPQPTHMTCLAGSCSYTVNWQGLLRPCVVMTEPEANVFTQGFSAAWEQVRVAADEIRFCTECGSCRLRPVCRTCAAACITETGDAAGKPEYLCRYAQESLRLLQTALDS